jgi:hypothetical protein
LGVVGEVGTIGRPRLARDQVIAFSRTRDGNADVSRDASSFDVTCDARFLMNQVASDSSDTPVTVIVNWRQLLKK